MSTERDQREAVVLRTYWLPYLNLRKRHPLLPGARSIEAEAAFIGLGADELMDARIRFDQATKHAALELLQDSDVIDILQDAPFGERATIAAVGDSITDDAQGWFEILRHVLEIGTEGEYRFVNGASWGNTSLDALRSFERDVISAKPDWVILALGTMDAMRLHGAPTRCLVSLADYWENVSAMESMTAEITRHPVLWITPAPVIATRMDELGVFEGTVHEADLRHVREVISGKTGIIVDPYGRRMGAPASEWNLGVDGLNHSISGHVQTVKHLLQAMKAAVRTES